MGFLLGHVGIQIEYIDYFNCFMVANLIEHYHQGYFPNRFKIDLMIIMQHCPPMARQK